MYGVRKTRDSSDVVVPTGINLHGNTDIDLAASPRSRLQGWRGWLPQGLVKAAGAI